MKNLVRAASFLVLDMASTFVYLAIFLTTKSIPLAAAAGVVFGVGEMLWERSHGKRIEIMQWMSLFLVVATSAAAFITNDPRFIMIKPSVIYVIVGVVMLKPGWMNRYLPADAIAYVPDLGIGFGFVWAGLMFVSAAVNIVAALHMSVLAWTGFMSAYALSTKIGLFLIQYATMRFVGRRRHEGGAGALAQAAAA